MVDAQEWLDQNYPKEIRGEIKELNISRKSLEGYLALGDFTNLEKLDCSFNNINWIQIKDCNKLTELDFSHNRFSNKRFLRELPHPENLLKLTIFGNDFDDLSYRWDLDVCHHFYNLQEFNGEKMKKKYVVSGEYEWESLNKGLKKVGKEMETRENNLNKEIDFWKGKCEWYKNYEEFQNKIENKEREIKWLKEQLKKVLGEEKYHAQIEVKYPLQFRK